MWKWCCYLSVGTRAHLTVTKISPDHPPATHHRRPLPLFPPLPLLPPTQHRKDGAVRQSDTENRIFILTLLPLSRPCLNTQLDPSLYFSVFFYFCSLPWLPRQDSLCCLSSHLLLPTVGICLFKLSPVLSGLSLLQYVSQSYSPTVSRLSDFISLSLPLNFFFRVYLLTNTQNNGLLTNQ